MLLTLRKASTLAVAGLISITLIGCSSAAVGTPSPTPAPTSAATASPQPASAAPTTVTPSAAPPSAAGPTSLPAFQEGDPHPIPAGTYTTDLDGFFPGLTISIPAGWTATESDDGELSLHPLDRSDDALLLWKDMAAVITNNRTGTVGQVLPGVAQTQAALESWLTHTSDFTILAKPKSATVGNGVKGDQLTLTTSKTANFAWADCPDNPHCVAILTDPEHWGGNYFAIGGKEVARIFVATLPYPASHTFWVTLDSVSAADLAAFAVEAQPIIDSLGIPASFIDN